MAGKKKLAQNVAADGKPFEISSETLMFPQPFRLQISGGSG